MLILVSLAIHACLQVSIRDRRGRNVMDYAVEGSGARKVLEEHLRQLESKATELQVCGRACVPALGSGLLRGAGWHTEKTLPGPFPVDSLPVASCFHACLASVPQLLRTCRWCAFTIRRCWPVCL